MELAVEECIQDDILKDFLMKNRSEAIKMSIFEYDEEKEMMLMKKSLSRHYYEEGHAEGLNEGHEQGLSEGKSAGLSLALKVMKAHSNGLTNREVADSLELELKTVEEILNTYENL